MKTGHNAIEFAEQTGATLNKFADPIEDAREGLTIEEAREIAAEDPSLIWVNDHAASPDKAQIPCPFASSVAQKIGERADVGLKKYGTTCARNDLSIIDWLTHLQEELMDAAVYIEKIKNEIPK